MSWFGRKKSQQPEPKSEGVMQSVRQNQIADLTLQNTGAKLVATDTYELVVSTHLGPLPFRVYLPPLFPSCGPVIRMEKGCQHKWIDPSLVVSLHPKLVDWQSHYSLGTIVREIYNEFTRSPPTPGQSQPAAAQQQPLVSSSLPPKFDNRSQPQAQPPKPKNKKNTIPQPELPKSFPLLNNKTNEELLALLGGGFEAQVAKMALVQDMATSKSMQTLRNDLYKGIDSLSKKNMMRQQEISDLTERLRTLQRQAKDAKLNMETAEARKEKVMEKFSADKVLSKLDDKIEEIEDASDALLDDYTKQDASDSEEDEEDDGRKKMSHNKFVREYSKLRQLAHERMAKKERLECQQEAAAAANSNR